MVGVCIIHLWMKFSIIILMLLFPFDIAAIKRVTFNLQLIWSARPERFSRNLHPPSYFLMRNFKTCSLKSKKGQ